MSDATDAMMELSAAGREDLAVLVNNLVAYNAKLETQITTIQDMFSDALQSDLEHGVKRLNENASKEFHEKYPELTQALCRLSEEK